MQTAEELQAQAQQHLQEHPELEEILREFQESWAQYQQYLATVTVSPAFGGRNDSYTDQSGYLPCQRFKSI